MGIAQIALDPSPLFQTGKREKNSAPNHPGKPIHPRVNVGKKRAPNHKLLTPSRINIHGHYDKKQL